MAISRPGRRGFTLVELTVVVAIMLALIMEWNTDYTGLVPTGELRRLEMEAHTIETACEAFHQARGRYPGSLGELWTGGLLDSLPEHRTRDRAGILLSPSRPGHRDVARAVVVDLATWSQARPPGGEGWD